MQLSVLVSFQPVPTFASSPDSLRHTARAPCPGRARSGPRRAGRARTYGAGARRRPGRAWRRMRGGTRAAPRPGARVAVVATSVSPCSTAERQDEKPESFAAAVTSSTSGATPRTTPAWPPRYVGGLPERPKTATRGISAGFQGGQSTLTDRLATATAYIAQADAALVTAAPRAAGGALHCALPAWQRAQASPRPAALTSVEDHGDRRHQHAPEPGAAG